MPTVEVEVYHVYHVWWDFVTDTFPPLSLLTYSHHGGILSWWEYAGKPPSSSPSISTQSMIYILLIMMFRPGLPALPGLADHGELVPGVPGYALQGLVGEARGHYLVIWSQSVDSG